MTAFDWVRMLLVEFLAPIAWPLVAAIALFVLKSELRRVVSKIAESIAIIGERMLKGKFGPVEMELRSLDPLQVEVKALAAPAPMPGPGVRPD